MTGASELSATRTRDVGVRIAEWALLAPLVLGSLWLLYRLLHFELGVDQGIYAVVSDAVLRGGAPYLESWDF